MINKPPLSNGLNIRIPTVIPIKGREFKGREFMNQGSGLASVLIVLTMLVQALIIYL